MYSCLLFGSLQRQKIGTEFLLQGRWQCTLQLVLGKGFIFPDSRQLTKCWRISNWLYLCVAGSKPWHKSVAKAKAMRPQSLPPSCFCTFSLQNVTVSCWEKSMRQAWSIKTELGLLYKLSNIFTMPAWQPMVLMHTQCLLTLIIWTNSDVAGITSDPLTAGS